MSSLSIESSSRLKTENSLNENQSIEINLVQQLLIEDGEVVESVEGVDLVKTYLAVEIYSDQTHGSADIEFLETSRYR